jgi:hypothetical protein
VSVNPAGRVPEESDQEYGANPPVAASATAYGAPEASLGKELVMIASVGTGGALDAIET